MRRANRSTSPSIMAAIAATVAACLPSTASAQAVAKPKPRVVSPAELKRLDAKLEDLRESFLRDTTTLIKGYEDAGQPERAKVLLEALGRLDPKNEAIQQKLADLRKTILDAREFEFELDPAKPWQPVGSVVKDEMLRIRATGDYTCSLEFTAGPDGLPTANPAEDVVGHVPFGAMMAVIASGVAEKDGKPPRPFVVGKDYEKPAERSGLLFLKVNLPPKSECTGKLTVQVSGATRPQ
jgi:hypothetical protein